VRHDFEKRFNIAIGEAEAQARFVNRIHTLIFDEFRWFQDSLGASRKAAALHLGERFHSEWDLKLYAKNEFHKTLRAIEAVYASQRLFRMDEACKVIDDQVRVFLERSEVDLGVTFENGQFSPTGAPILDKALVNDPLDWCRRKGLESVVKPFEKALTYLLEAKSKPIRSSDAITDAYEAVEALAKIASGRDSGDLSKNSQALIAALKSPPSVGEVLRVFIKWGNLYRHAEGATMPRATASYPEAEAFVYQAGIFIRLWSQRESNERRSALPKKGEELEKD
jgi:hypothetical protein